MRRWFMWIPVLMVASLLFWTLALALGGMSLMAANKISLFDSHCRWASPEASADMDGAGSRNGYDPIVVRIQESGDPDDLDDDNEPVQAAPAATDEDVVQVPVTESPSQPGQTSF